MLSKELDQGAPFFWITIPKVLFYLHKKLYQPPMQCGTHLGAHKINGWVGLKGDVNRGLMNPCSLHGPNLIDEPSIQAVSSASHPHDMSDS